MNFVQQYLEETQKVVAALDPAALEKMVDELARVRDAGFKRVQISFLIGNEPAEHAYRKVGFEFAQEKRAPDFEAACGSPGLRRLARDLQKRG